MTIDPLSPVTCDEERFMAVESSHVPAGSRQKPIFTMPPAVQ